MKHLTVLLTTIFTFVFSASSFACGELSIQDPYARATPPNAPASAIFLKLENKTDVEKTIISASTPAAGRVELHSHIMEDGVMKMRQVDSIKVPAMSEVELKPGSLHIMLYELKQEFKEGEDIEVSINFSNGAKQKFTAKIKKVMKGMKKNT